MKRSNRPIRLQNTGELKVIPVLIDFAFRHLLFQFLFLQSFITELMRSRLNQMGINGYSFVDGQSFGCKLKKYLGIDFGHYIFRQVWQVFYEPFVS